MAHELAHVVQQGQAGAVADGQVSQPGDSFEQTADSAAQGALQGRQVESTTGGTPPAIQRQFKDPNAAGRPEVEQEIRAFLQRAKVINPRIYEQDWPACVEAEAAGIAGEEG